MKKGCDFCSEDEDLAYDHIDTGADHPIVEITLTDNKVICRRLDLREHDEVLELNEEEIA